MERAKPDQASKQPEPQTDDALTARLRAVRLGLCPQCKGADLSRDDVDGGGVHLYLDWSCNICGYAWIEVYKFVGGIIDPDTLKL
jgi:hypothetical protein